ncbi:MAG: hypothetical protein V7K94_31410 [Nostoc sp.]|uniref:hypothetical protein n=1 Tax=Nostoc sp. TaxID=1180 RepID=UPI002FF96826
MPSATSTQAIEISPYRQEETQSYELQEWEGYNWVIFCFEVRAITNRGQLRHRTKVKGAVVMCKVTAVASSGQP